MSFLTKKSPLDRYIADVKSYLPRKSRNDIVEELRANLSEKLADRAEDSDGELTEDAEIQMLSDFGHPLRVAAEYQGDGRSLIGPTLYPFYRMSVLVSLAISTCVIGLAMLAEVFFRVDLGDSSRPWIFVNSYIYIIGLITVGYVLTERLMERYNYLDSWQPNALEQPDNVLANAWGSLIACIASVTWLVILNIVDIDHELSTLLGGNPNPLHTLIFWLKIQTVLLIPQYFYMAFNQTWSKNRLILRIGTELVLSVGSLIVLTTNGRGVLDSYPDVPLALSTVFTISLSGMLLAGLIGAYSHWRKLSQVAESYQ